ncbi:cytochrome c [Tasmannia lanceolata]|uniref:cytochrome c n=1 Tax=Tasmannia lanceolata TaxID=3420 RepID=UPI0040630F68
MLALSVISACKNPHSLLTKGEGCGKEENQCFYEHKRPKILKCLAPPLMAALLTLSPLCITPVSVAQLTDAQREATLFHRACIGCHVGGGNIIQPGATLFMEDLQKNRVATEEGIYGITYYGKGRMPASVLPVFLFTV